MKIYIIFILALLFFSILVSFVPSGFIPTNLADAILKTSTFLFAILAGFCIAATITDYNDLRTNISREIGEFINLYRNIYVYNQEQAQKLAALIDVYIRRTFDYEIIEYAKQTELEFANIEHFIKELPIEQEKISIFQKILSTMEQLTNSRQKLFVLNSHAVPKIQWIILVTLALTIIFSLLSFSTDNLFFKAMIVVISACLVLVLRLIQELDLCIWNEETFAYELYQNVFKAIGQLPYYPAESIKNGRYISEEKEYRVGTLIDPKTFERKIDTIKN